MGRGTFPKNANGIVVTLNQNTKLSLLKINILNPKILVVCILVYLNPFCKK